MRQLSFNRLAESELAEVAGFYDKESPGLDRVRILAVAHQKRHPRYWVGRA